MSLFHHPYKICTNQVPLPKSQVWPYILVLRFFSKLKMKFTLGQPTFFSSILWYLPKWWSFINTFSQIWQHWNHESEKILSTLLDCRQLWWFLVFSIFGFRQKKFLKKQRIYNKIFFIRNIYLISANFHPKNEITD